MLTFVPQEAAPLLRRLRDSRRVAAAHGRFRRGTLGRIPVLVGIVGPGRRNAERGFAAAQELEPAAGVCILGVAAGLVPHLGIADLILADRVRHEDGRDLVPHLPERAAIETAAGLRRAPVLTVDRILVEAESKRNLSGHAWVADMETLHVAGLAHAAGIPWCALRAVSDAAHESLAIDFNRCLSPEGDLHLPRILREVAARPRAIAGLLRLERSTRRAATALARAAEAYLPEWYESVPTAEGIKQAVG